MGEGFPGAMPVENQMEATEWAHHVNPNLTAEQMQDFINQNSNVIHPGLAPHLENQGYDVSAMQVTGPTDAEQRFNGYGAAPDESQAAQVYPGYENATQPVEQAAPVPEGSLPFPESEQLGTPMTDADSMNVLQNGHYPIQSEMPAGSVPFPHSEQVGSPVTDAESQNVLDGTYNPAEDITPQGSEPLPESYYVSPSSSSETTQLSSPMPEGSVSFPVQESSIDLASFDKLNEDLSIAKINGINDAEQQQLA